MELNIKQTKLKDGKRKLNEKIQNMNQKNIYDFQQYETG